MKPKSPRGIHAQRQAAQLLREFSKERAAIEAVSARFAELVKVQPPTADAVRELEELARTGLAVRARLADLARKLEPIVGAGVVGPLLAALDLPAFIPTSPPSSSQLQ